MIMLVLLKWMLHVSLMIIYNQIVDEHSLPASQKKTLCICVFICEEIIPKGLMTFKWHYLTGQKWNIVKFNGKESSVSILVHVYNCVY